MIGKVENVGYFLTVAANMPLSYLVAALVNSLVGAAQLIERVSNAR